MVVQGFYGVVDDDGVGVQQEEGVGTGDVCRQVVGASETEVFGGFDEEQVGEALFEEWDGAVAGGVVYDDDFIAQVFCFFFYGADAIGGELFS